VLWQRQDLKKGRNYGLVRPRKLSGIRRFVMGGGGEGLGKSSNHTR